MGTFIPHRQLRDKYCAHSISLLFSDFLAFFALVFGGDKPVL
jgi:hypothetical protein